MTMTATPPVALPARQSSQGGIYCQKCGALLHGRITAKTSEPIKAVFWQKCKDCKHFNVVDLENLT